MEKCIFCEREDIVLENRLAWAKYDIYPVSTGHILIISKRHIPDFFSTTPEERQAMSQLLDEAKELLDQEYHPDGYNIGINCGEYAGQTVMHLHIHLIPRYRGDMENPKGGVRGVVPEKRGY
ncbi:MAG: HIT family protein [Clostridiaceae bacterium]|nr:HIT family protein [Clostridiaceae bacterium]